MCIIRDWTHSFMGNFNFNRYRLCEHHKIQCHETPHRKEVESSAKVTQNMLAYMGIEPRTDPYIGSIGSKTRRYEESLTRVDEESHLMRIT